MQRSRLVDGGGFEISVDLDSEIRIILSETKF